MSVPSAVAAARTVTPTAAARPSAPSARQAGVIPSDSDQPSDWLRDDEFLRDFRGGSWRNYARHCLATNRLWNWQDWQYNDLGFRPAFRLVKR